MSDMLNRLAALLVLALVAGAVYVLAIEPVTDLSAALDAEIAETRDRIVRFQRLANTKPAYQEQIETLETKLPLDDDLLAGESAAIAAAALQDHVRAIVEANGSRVGSAQAVKPEAIGDLSAIGVKFEFDGTVETLRAILHALESGQPIVIVDRLQLRAEKPRDKNAVPGERESVKLSVALHVSGFRRTESAAGAD